MLRFLKVAGATIALCVLFVLAVAVLAAVLKIFIGVFVFTWKLLPSFQ